MPLNKLDNFFKNAEGRILYVNPNDLDSTDSVENEGNSLARPFKTIQRALLEAARFSYISGNNNDIVEKTTILLFPGEHLVDNRPGYAIYDNSGAKAVSRSGSESLASSTFSLELDSVFDLTSDDNILYKFNSFYGGVIVPRGTSIIGLDLRKTKIRPKYVPNPTDDFVEKSAIFRITGGCYFWQFSFFDADSGSFVYTNPDNFSSSYRSIPIFSHHKLTCFEFCDGVNNIESYGLTDLDMYYGKLSNAYNSYRNISQKYPENSLGFSKRNPEWEIVGSFASDPISISSIISGNGSTSSSIVTVTTRTEHGLNVGTPVKIRGVSGPGIVFPYNISTTVQNVINSTTFTYLLPSFNSYPTLNPNPSSSSATVTVETDTVSGASPYIFNCSLRSVWGMNGIHADGSKSSGFRSTVVAQFTAVSLQKDDRAFVKYNKTSRIYEGVNYSTVYGSRLSEQSSETNSNKVYHLDSDAIYRNGWESSHIKSSNDSFIQIVSVFAIGFNKHFDVENGGDASITNSNSNFGQISLSSSGFKKESFDKDNKAFITSIIPPRAIVSNEEQVEWVSLDVGLTTSVGISSHLYLYGFTSPDIIPSSITQGYRIGAKFNDKIFVDLGETTKEASIYMCNNAISSSGFTTALGTTSAVKEYDVISGPTSNSFTIGSNNLLTGEKVKIVSNIGDLPENIQEHQTYYIINNGDNDTVKLASSFTNAFQNEEIDVYGGTGLSILSRVSDKESGNLGSPVQFDSENNNWFIHVNQNNEIYNELLSGGVATYTESTEFSYVKRIADSRSLDEKLYKIRVVIPKELSNAKNPETGFVIQESSTTGVRNNADFTRNSITSADYEYLKNTRFISTCSVSSSTITIISELPHNLQVGDIVIIKNIASSTNTEATYNIGYNGRFEVNGIIDSYTFTYSSTDVDGKTHIPGVFTSGYTLSRTINLPRFERSDWQSNLYIYRDEIISEYIEGKQDGIYHLYVLNANNKLSDEFTNLKFSQLSVDLYPQLDRDNPDENPLPSRTFAKLSPIGAVVTNDLKKSVTKESTDLALKTVGVGLTITSVLSTSGISTITFSRFHGLSGIITGFLETTNFGYNEGTYYNVKLLNNDSDPLVGVWKGATAKVIVDPGGNISSVDVISSGSGYGDGDVLYPDSTVVGSGSNATYTVSASGISTNIGDVVQFTGSNEVPDGYHRIVSIPSETQIAIAKTSSDPTISLNHYALVLGPSAKITDFSYNSTTGIATFTTSSAHGLLAGNRFRVINSSNGNIGDYIVKERTSVSSFTAITNTSLSPINGFILKHGLSGNEGVSDNSAENLGVRGVSFYKNETFILTSAVTTESTISISSSGIGTDQRLPIGSYIQIDNEIMRIASVTNTTASVIRGSLGTNQENHDSNSLIRKINPIAIEFRRPSIIRASGHTFEYLGYGPGNYSTSLPQVQVKTLNDQENFLANSQERSAGVVVYTGMDNSGDFYSGNTKTSSASGEVLSYDIPKPTVTGEESSKLSVVYDEVIVKERLLVEGGSSGQILSQFDGPVTFNKEIRVKGQSTFNGKVRIKNTSSDALRISGGIVVDDLITVKTGILPDNDKGAYIGSSSKAFSEAYIGEIKIGQSDDNTIDTTTGNLKINATTGSVVAIQTNTTLNGNLDLTISPVGSGRIKANYLEVPNISPIGSIMIWSGPIDSWPTSSWALCNGQTLSKTTYPDLWNIIGYTYGGSDDSFNLPDLRERFVVGAGGNNTSVIGGSAGDSYSVGSTGGNKDLIIPYHNHNASSSNTGNHTHRFITSKDSGNFQADGGNGGFITDNDTYNQSIGNVGNPTTQKGGQIGGAFSGDVDDSGRHQHIITVNFEGTEGNSVNANLPPYMGLIYIIRIQ